MSCDGYSGLRFVDLREYWGNIGVMNDRGLDRVTSIRFLSAMSSSKIE